MLQMLKQRRLHLLAAILAAALLLASGCSGADTPDDTQVQVNDPLNGDGILTASELADFIEHGSTDSATLAASVDMGDAMLELTAARGKLTIDGNGFTLSGTGDCVIRLEDGASIALNNMTVTGSRSAIGCLGNASIAGEGLVVNAVENAIDGEGDITIGDGSSMEIVSSTGMALRAKGLDVGQNASLDTSGEQSAVEITDDDMLLEEGASLSAVTAEAYNALKCEGSLDMRDGSKLDVDNLSYYHGAELGSLSVEGAVTIKAKGGKKGAGLFLFELDNDVYVLGSCKPAPRYEVGDGSINFVDSKSKIPTPKPTATPSASATSAG